MKLPPTALLSGKIRKGGQKLFQDSCIRVGRTIWGNPEATGGLLCICFWRQMFILVECLLSNETNPVSTTKPLKDSPAARSFFPLIGVFSPLFWAVGKAGGVCKASHRAQAWVQWHVGRDLDHYQSLWLQQLHCLKALSVLTNTAPIRNYLGMASDIPAPCWPSKWTAPPSSSLLWQREGNKPQDLFPSSLHLLFPP